MDTGGDMLFTDDSNTDVTLSELLAGGSSPWQVSSNVITPLVSGDVIRLGADEHLEFSVSTAYINGAGNEIFIRNAGSLTWTFTDANNSISYGHIFPADANRDLGSESDFWRQGYIKKMYADATAYIDYSGTELQLTDGVTGTKTLAELALGNYRVEVIEITHGDDGVPQIIAALTTADVAWWDVRLYVTVTFDSAAPQLRIGNSAHTDVYYYSPADPGWGSTGWKTISLNNDPDRIAGAENITCQYDDASVDGSQGTAYLYLFYTTH
jgi:hypothetical protein